MNSQYDSSKDHEISFLRDKNKNMEKTNKGFKEDVARLLTRIEELERENFELRKQIEEGSTCKQDEKILLLKEVEEIKKREE